ncbi:MAG: FG-GAP-like repeat-containing protein [Pirellulaceae bacterium]|nr:FG-GAP-like repeat-containing protein [Pirellulaceae bacterium]
MNRISMNVFIRSVIVASLLGLSPLHVGAQDGGVQGLALLPQLSAVLADKPTTTPRVESWPHWRGPTADGRAGERAKPPIAWDKSTNIAWTVDLLGEGSATPIVHGNQVFVLSAVKTERKSPKPVVNDERAKTVPDEFFYQFVVSSYDRNSGKTLWQQIVVEEVPHEGKHETNTYAAGSPVTDGERLYFSFGSRGVFCYTLEGSPVWKIDLGDMRTRSGWGESVTPALTEDSVVINWDQEEGSFIAAIDKQTGEIRWKKDRTGEVTSWNTPFVTRFEDIQQIIVNGTGSVKSYDAKDGSVLWECAGQTVNAIPSPIRFQDSVICMSGYRGSLACPIPLNSRGNMTDSAQIGWRITQGTPYVPSPILSGTRLLFTAGNTNALSCMDANTGKPLLDRKRLDAIRTLYASPILAGGHFYFTSREGTTVVLKDNENLDVVAVNAIDDVIDASPVAVDDQLFLRSWGKLYCIEEARAAKREDASQKSQQRPVAAFAFKQINLEDSSETSANASVGDLDGDGDMDVVLAKGRHWPLHNRVLLNDGQGNFQAKNLGSQPDRSYTATLGDIDNDGDLDIVVSNDKPDEKVTYKNDGKANFALADSWGEPSWNTRNIGLVDLNRDGFHDLVVANRKSSSYTILNDGHGNFSKDKWSVIPSESATTIVAADFDRDGFVDLAVPHRDGGASRILFNDEKLSFQRATEFGHAISSTRACAAGDLNGDGAADLIVGDDQLGTSVCINDGQGNFPTTAAIGEPKLVAYSIATGFMNRDDRLDLVVGYSSGGSRVFLNDGTGTQFQEVPFGDAEGAVYGMAVGDFNADDSYDIVQARSDAPNTVFFCSESVSAQIKRETRDISGWQVHIDTQLLTTEADATAKALDGLKKMLDEIVRDVPAEAVAEMKKVPLYFSPAYKPGRSGAEFHPGAEWLRDNGRDPVMALGVEFSGVDDFEAEMRRMPNFALHELAHAYHFRALPNGFDNAEIKAAYQRAQKSGLYDRVERTFGNGKPNTFERAYAMTSPMEYFAETSEAYFFRNDFFPFTREELLRHDPELHRLLEKLWGVSETKWLSYPGADGPGKNKHIVLIAAEQEYRSEQSLPMLAKILSTHHGFDCTVLFGVNENGEVDPTLPVYPEKGKEAEFKEHHIPGLEQLASADLVIFCTRLLTLPKSDVDQIVRYVDSGKPIIALRTANHGFRGPLPYKIDGKQVRWGEDVLGGTFLNHHGRWHADSTRGFFDKAQTQNPILIGVNDIWGDSDVYRTYKEGSSLPMDCTALVWGQPLMGRKPDDLPNDKLEPLPVAWVKPWQTSNGNAARVFHCTMGSASDFKNQGLRRLIVNAAYWCVGLEASISAARSVDIVGSYQPLESGFNYQELGVKPQPVEFYK